MYNVLNRDRELTELSMRVEALTRQVEYLEKCIRLPHNKLGWYGGLNNVVQGILDHLGLIISDKPLHLVKHINLIEKGD